MPVISGYWVDDERDYPDEDFAEDALTMACLRYPDRAEALQKALAEKHNGEPDHV